MYGTGVRRDVVGLRQACAVRGFFHCVDFFLISCSSHVVFYVGCVSEEGLPLSKTISMRVSRVLPLCGFYISFDLSIWYFKYLGILLAPESCYVFFSVREGSHDALRKL